MNQSLIGWVFVLIYLTCYFFDIKFFSFEYFQGGKFFAHLLNCSRSEVSFSSCNFCSLLLADNASPSFCLSIDHYFKLMFSKNYFSQTASEIFNVEKNNRFGLNIFYGSKTVYEIIKSDEQRCIKYVTVLNQFDLIILFPEVFVRIFCHHFYLISLFCFSLKKLQKVFLKENIVLMHLCLFLKVFLKQLCSRFILAH